MSSSAAKKDDDRFFEVPDLPPDREQRLSQNFEDPALDDLIPNIESSEAAGGILQETVAAVQELMQDASPELELSPETFYLEPPHSQPTDESSALSSRCNMAEELFQLVVCERSFDQLAQEVLRTLVAGTGAQAGAVLECDQEKQEYFFRAIWGGGNPAQVKTFRVPMNKGIVGHVAEAGKALLFNNLEKDALQMRAISMSVGFDANSCLAAPLLVAGKLYGVVELFNRTDGQPFDENNLRSLEAGVAMAVKVLEVRFLLAELAKGRGKGSR